MAKPTVFISYSHEDEAWKDRLVTHLGVLQSQGLLDLWDDRRIGAGEDWEREIEKAMATASAAVLLVSADFLTSAFILGEEVPRLLERRDRDKESLRIFPVIVKPCAWKQVKWLARMQVRPQDGRPLSAGDEHRIDADLAAIAEEVAAIMDLISPTPQRFPAAGVDLPFPSTEIATPEAVSEWAPKAHQVDFAIITALEKEAKAIVRRLENHTVKRFEDRDIRTYHCGTVPIQDTDRAYRVVVVLLPSMGEIPAAVAVTDAVTCWKPRFVLMVGIAGGIPQDDLDLGDVVVADQIVGYEYGKVTDEGIKPRDRVYPVSALLLDRVRNFWDESWTGEVNVPRPGNAARPVSKLFVGPIASGNKVIASTGFRQQLKTRWPKLIALEMEGEGVFAAVFDRPQIRNALVIRGICDMADERKSDEWQEYAADAAAAFAVSFLRSGPVEP